MPNETCAETYDGMAMISLFVIGLLFFTKVMAKNLLYKDSESTRTGAASIPKNASMVRLISAAVYAIKLHLYSGGTTGTNRQASVIFRRS